MSKEEVVARPSGVVRFDATRCIHARHCVIDRPDVFVPNVEGEWIHPERATPSALLELTHNCPSGAIRSEHADGSAMETAPLVNVVRVRENGPLAFRAALSVDAVPVGYRLTLCRCGASHNKPFCDGSHASVGFVASGEPPSIDSQPLAERGGPLELRPLPDGPLHVRGSIELLSGTGRTVNRVTECWLCRCGQSKDRPHCDGCHREAGFRST